MNMLKAISLKLFGKVPFCGLNGGILGIIVGFLFGLLQFAHPTADHAVSEIIIIILTMILVSWAYVLLVVGVWLRYGAKQIALPLLLSAAITGTLTVLANLLLNQIALAVPVGWLIGIVVGTLLCWLCNRGYLTLEGLTHVR